MHASHRANKRHRTDIQSHKIICLWWFIYSSFSFFLYYCHRYCLVLYVNIILVNVEYGYYYVWMDEMMLMSDDYGFWFFEQMEVLSARNLTRGQIHSNLLCLNQESQDPKRIKFTYKMCLKHPFHSYTSPPAGLMKNIQENIISSNWKFMLVNYFIINETVCISRVHPMRLYAFIL